MGAGASFVLAAAAHAQTLASQNFDQSWQEMRDNDAIQYEPVVVPQKEPSPPPDWLVEFLNWLGRVFSGIGGQWFWLKWVLLAIGIALLAYLIIRIVNPEWFQFNRRNIGAPAPGEPDWVPSEDDAKALLGDADTLAAQGDYDAATHLLLLRSVEQIADARPDLVEPSSTARELGALSFLPLDAKYAFSAISERVERSIFALQGLTRDDWEQARAAYAKFALDGSGAKPPQAAS